MNDVPVALPTLSLSLYLSCVKCLRSVDNQCSHKWSQIKFKRIGLKIMEMTLPSNKMTSQWENTALSEPFQVLIGKILEIKRKTKHMTLSE